MRTTLASVCLALVSVVAANGQTVTGNPALDGWTSMGNSFQSGVYVRGGGGFSYSTYASNFTIAAGSNLLNGVTSPTALAGWNIGDQVLGIGGSFVTAPAYGPAGWGSDYNLAATGTNGGTFGVNNNITTSLRMVGKFGTSNTAWEPSTIAPSAGNGLGSSSAGDGGVDAILLNTTGSTSLANSGVLRGPNEALHASGTFLDQNIGRVIYITNASGVVTSWQMMLNLNLLNSLYGGTYGDLPQIGDLNIVTVQRSSNAVLFHDALVPTPGAAAALGLGGLAGLRRRRR